ncbi:MAG: hypothetical protein L6Q51_02405 [Cyclobacteriaceae bacterium]|nr:hypothetical protein [Cyclobacteriaceae bacterium]
MRKSGLSLLVSLMLALCSFSSAHHKDESIKAQTEQTFMVENDNDCIALGFATANAFQNLANSNNLIEAGLWFSLAWYYFDQWATCI